MNEAQRERMVVFLANLPKLLEKHPLPWAWSDVLPDEEGMIWIVDATEKPIIFIADMEAAEGVDLTLADLIVGAVNMYTHLVEAINVWTPGEPKPLELFA